MTAPGFDGSQPCRGRGELFFPLHTSLRQIAAAKAICATCPFEADCAEYALTHTLPGGAPLQGVWGSLSDDDRKALRRRGAA